MSAGLPNLGMHDDRGVDADAILALLGHAAPPVVLDVALEFRAQWAVVPEAVQAAVDFGGLKDEAAPLAQRHDLFHEFVGFRLGHRSASLVTEGPDVKGSARFATENPPEMGVTECSVPHVTLLLAMKSPHYCA